MIDLPVENHAAKTGSDRLFGLVWAGFLAIVGIYGTWKNDAALWPWISAAGFFAAVALIRPSFLAPLNRLWFRFGLLLAKLIQPIVLGLLFFLVVTPIGLVARLAGKDFLRMKYDSAAKSYWIPRDPPGPPPETMSRQF